MKRIYAASSHLLIVALIAALGIAAPAIAQVQPDVITVGSVSGGGVVDVPVFIPRQPRAHRSASINQPARASSRTASA